MKARLILGSAWGERAPVKVFGEMFYADVELAPGARVPLPDGHEDRGLYIVSGSVVVGGQRFEAAQMMVFRPGDRLHVTAGPEGARLMLLGGETMGGPRYIWWNFVASSRERIEAAKEAWRAGRLGARPVPAAAGRRRRVHPAAAGAGRARGRARSGSRRRNSRSSGAAPRNPPAQPSTMAMAKPSQPLTPTVWTAVAVSRGSAPACSKKRRVPATAGLSARTGRRRGRRGRRCRRR